MKLSFRPRLAALVLLAALLEAAFLAPRRLRAPPPADADRLPGKTVPAAYGPLPELLFRLAARLDGFAAFKLLSVLFDLGTLLVLVGLLRARREPPVRALLYGWGSLGGR